MKSKATKNRTFVDKLVSKYRLVILNENTFEEQVSFKLTRLNVFVLFFISALILIVSTVLLIAFTSLREFIPGYSSSKLTSQANNLVYKTDSLFVEVAGKEQFYESIKKVLKGEIKAEKFNIDATKSAIASDLKEAKLNPSAQELALRKEVDKIEKYSVQNATDFKSDYLFFPPVKGTVISRFNFQKKNYAVAISVPKNTPIKAASTGVVIYSEWSPKAGYVIIVKHKSGLISVYKHNSKLTKGQGEYVTAGEVIAFAGATGELSKGTHLHFELWDNGKALDPMKFIDFEK